MEAITNRVIHPQVPSLSERFSSSYKVNHPFITMSDTCGNCDCSDKSQCVKKGSSYTAEIVVTKSSSISTVVMDVPAAEHDGDCKCGANCTCTNCTCG